MKRKQTKRPRRSAHLLRCKTCVHDIPKLRRRKSGAYPGYACAAGVIVNRDGRSDFCCNRHRFPGGDKVSNELLGNASADRLADRLRDEGVAPSESMMRAAIAWAAGENRR